MKTGQIIGEDLSKDFLNALAIHVDYLSTG